MTETNHALGVLYIGWWQRRKDVPVAMPAQALAGPSEPCGISMALIRFELETTSRHAATALHIGSYRCGLASASRYPSSPPRASSVRRAT